MKTKWLSLLVSIFLVTAACNLTSKVFNPAGNIVSEIEELADQVDLQELEEELGTLATELPANLEKIPNAEDLGNLEATIQVLQEGFGSGDVPADIPIVGEVSENLYGSENIVSYVTSMAFDEVLAFYQAQMPVNSWDLKQEGTMIGANTALLIFEKPDRNATVSLGVSPQDGKTFVMITIQSK